MTTTHLLYLHGFRSSPQSAKARQTAAYVARERPDLAWWCPQLPPSPKQAIALLASGVADWPRESMAVIGSSLGGFYATWLAEHTGCRAALLNPAVHPARDLARHIGQQTHWHQPDSQFFFKSEYVDELRALACGELQHPARYFCIIAKGDEVLDWREMVARYRTCPMLLLEGGDHAISDFAQHLSTLMAQLNC